MGLKICNKSKASFHLSSLGGSVCDIPNLTKQVGIDKKCRFDKKKRHPTKLHPRKLTCPLKRDYFNRKYIFQPSFFKGYVSFHGGK